MKVLAALVVFVVATSAHAAPASLPVGEAASKVVTTTDKIESALAAINLPILKLDYRSGKLIDDKRASVRKRIQRLKKFQRTIELQRTVFVVALFRDDTESILLELDELDRELSAVAANLTNEHQYDLALGWATVLTQAGTPLISAAGDFDEAAYDYYESVDAQLTKCQE